MLTDDVLDLMQRSVLCWLATVDAHGRPNVSPKEVFTASGRDAVLIAHIASPGSVRNLGANAQACLSFIDIFSQKGFKLRGAAEVVLPGDARFAGLEAPLLAITRGVFPIRAVMVLKVAEVETILAPSYRMVPGTTEASQRDGAMRTYGVMPRLPAPAGAPMPELAAVTVGAGAGAGASELQQYLHQHIPLSAAMQVQVMQATPEAVVLAAPLAPNINHRDTVFGGSASALGILAAWSLLHVRLRGAGLTGRLVIQRNTMDYLAPMAGEFEAHATLGDPADWQRFERMLQRKGTGRISVAAELRCAGRRAGSLVGEFVALDATRDAGSGGTHSAQPPAQLG